ncbi:hypothetical protein GJ496_000425 [Pomphorhynchus laevis]|nr:hypothetical protein GJ496_000425 [Pomphorhynchus laevis]
MPVNDDESEIVDNRSPLRLFSNAKQELTDCFCRLENLCEEMTGFVSSLECYNSDIKCELPIQVHLGKVQAILKVISRNNMKVVFFGRTSNGKSTVINSMLCDQILPSGLGHTTNCFIQISGTEEDKSSFRIAGSDQTYPIKELNKFNSQDSESRVSVNEMIQISWPKERCALLNEDIVLIDSPGIDVSADLDSWIEKHCMDADVFVLVSNAESVLSRTEKQFFFSVREKLSSPNIFILNNRWDATADEDDHGQRLRKNHEDMEISFLCDELHVCSNHEEASKRIYFISAKESLRKRIGLEPSSVRLPGCEQRLEEFSVFEKEFTICLSKSAVFTKFRPHAERGIFICNEIKAYLDELYIECSQKENQFNSDYDKAVREVEHIENTLHELTAVVKDKIRKVVESVEYEVGLALESEIQILFDLIGEFEIPFSSDDDNLQWYKKELHMFIEKKLGEKMSSRLGNVLLRTLDNVQNDIRGDILKLVSVTKEKDVQSVMSRTDFSVAYRFYCTNLCADFVEDISFRFSLSPTAIFSKVFRLFNLKSDSVDDQEFSNNFIDTATTMMPALRTASVLSSANGMLILTASSIVWKGIGWRFVLICVGAYGLIFAYERLMWTRKAQELQFKRQYVDYAANKLYSMIDMISGNASHQVQEELSLFFAQMCKFVDESKDEQLDEIRKLKESKFVWASISKKTAKIRSNANSALGKILKFTKEYLEA